MPEFIIFLYPDAIPVRRQAGQFNSQEDSVRGRRER